MVRADDAPTPGIADKPLIATKLAMPPSRPHIVTRPRLLETIDGSPAPVTIIDAPLGYGKTVLAQSWCVHQQTAPVAWVSLDEADNDPVRLWTYIATAVDGVRRGLGGRALSRLRVPGGDLDAAVVELLNGMEAFRDPMVVVLDDLHTITDPETFATIRFAVAHLPYNARLLVVTRHDPPLPLARMRSNGRLLELRARELAFTVEETRELLARSGVTLGDEETGLLVDRTEGWPAGVYLALLWLRQAEDAGASVRGFHASHRHVADYLASDVLETLTPEDREFLTHTSLLERFSAPLCDAVLGRTGSDRVLEELARQNLFLVPIDDAGVWFRYHNLFRELLRLELLTADPGAVPIVHAHAQRWLLDHGFVEEAVDHAFRSGDEDAALAVIVDQYRRVMESSGDSLLLVWIARLSPAALAKHPELAAGGALVAGILSRPPEERRRLITIASSVLEPASEVSDPHVRGMVTLARATWMNGDAGAAVKDGQEAVRFAKAAGGDFEVPALASLAHALFLSGRPWEAEAAALAAAEHPDAVNRSYGYIGALAVLAMVDVGAGRVRAAQDHAAGGIAFARQVGIDRGWIGALARMARAVAAEAAGNLQSAERDAVAASTLYERDIDLPYAYSMLVRSRVRIRLGHLRRGAEDLAEARRAIAGFPDPGMLCAMSDDLEEELARARAELGDQPVTEPPSAAELAVLRLLGTDLSLRRIGDARFISLNTVKSHTRELYRKLGVSSRREAVVRAQALGLLEDESPG